MTDRKEKQQKAIEELSPEALKEKIESDKRKIIRNMIFIAAAAIALIAIGIAWFVSNSLVDASLGTVSAKYSGIEIGSSGSAGVHDDFLRKIKEAITYYLPDSNKHDTSQGGSINWLLNKDSNMNNYNDGKPFDDQNGTGLRKDYAMEPGQRESLIFISNRTMREPCRWTFHWILRRIILIQIIIHKQPWKKALWRQVC